ncbi:hypothetical protein [Paenibacillus cineris]|uniref:Uncharacterized protein n=1 Tax=Paenibacillus cineris TaxID=237530 RepID=A0ABQ4LK97_9BACL|nr:hypothetical protein [Paenibacillus cineris]GIO56939.1 hypothetical protein J21TS7_52570 [Paenibacillus cineris]
MLIGSFNTLMASLITNRRELSLEFMNVKTMEGVKAFEVQQWDWDRHGLRKGFGK